MSAEEQEQSAEQLLDDALRRAPTGHKTATALIDALRDRDDRHVEGAFLELKSVDRWDASIHAKIAKFILAAGNRTSVGEDFEGRAVMVLGIDPSGTVSGVPKRDDHEIRESLEKLLPRRSPDWDFIIVHDRATGHDVVVLHVSPPDAGERLFVAERDSDELLDGQVYVRSGSQTRRANSRELYALLDREHVAPVVDVRVEALAPVAFAGIAEMLGSGIREAKYEQLAARRREADALKAAEKSDPNARLAAMVRQVSGGLMEQLNKPPTWEGIETWQAAFDEHWESVKADWVGLMWPASNLEIVNESSAFLEDVDIDIRVPKGVMAVRHREGAYYWESMRRDLPGIAAQSAYPVIPALWDRTPLYDAHAENRDGRVNISIHLPKLPPEGSVTATSGFALCATDSTLGAVQCEWSLTAKGHNIRYRGTTDFAVSAALDVAMAVEAVLRNDAEANLWAMRE